MTDTRRRLHLVTQAAYSASPAAAGTEAGVSPGGAVGEGHQADGGTRVDGGGRADAEAPAEGKVGSDVVTDAQAGGSTHANPWPRAEEPRGNRWGTPALMAARVGVVVLLIAAAAAVTIVLTRPSAPVHQPELAWPDPPALATQEEEGPGAEGAALVSGRDAGAGGPEPEASAPIDLIVHIAGAVREPGIVELPEGARVHEALIAAGGPTAEADLAALNLAAPAQDGQQIYVPAHGEEPRRAAAASPGAGAATGGHGDLVDLNAADSSQLQTLPGIGPAMADRILAYRDEHGPFTHVDDLQAVSGIGPATLARLRDLVTV